MKYETWLMEWLNVYVKSTIKERTYEKYVCQVRNHILPKLGERQLTELSLPILQEFITELSERGSAPNTVNGILSIVKSSLKKAVLIGKIEKEYASYVSPPRAREKRVECFNKSEQKQLERYIVFSGKHHLYGVVLCLYTGLRIGELLALEWSDVDLQKGVIYVNKSCHDHWEHGTYVKIIDTPKTNSSLRVIPIAKPIKEGLKRLKKYSVGKYVIGNQPHGAEVRCYQRTFQTLLARLNLPPRGFHSLRHTFATRALECGMDVQTLSELLGHQNAAVTLKRYAHSMLEHKIEMMNRLGKLFG